MYLVSPCSFFFLTMVIIFGSVHIAPSSPQAAAKQQTSLENLVWRMIKPHHGPLHLYKRFRLQEKSNVYRQNEDSFTHQQSLDSVLGYFYEHCLAPSFMISSLNEGVRKFGVRNTTLDKLSRFLLSVPGGAERKSFDLDTLKMILRSLNTVRRIPRCSTHTQVSVQHISKTICNIDKQLSLDNPFLEFSKQILQLVSALKHDGGELTREEKMTALKTILKVVTMNFGASLECDSALRELVRVI